MHGRHVWFLRAAVLLAVAFALSGCGSSSSPAPDAGSTLSADLAGMRNGDVAPGRYIVVLREGVAPQDVARAHGFVPDFVYDKAFNGFAGPGTAAQARRLATDGRVKLVEPDRVVSLAPPGPIELRKPGGGSNPPGSTSETLPTGVSRMGVEKTSTGGYTGTTNVSAIGIAIIDTGIYLSHEDLNVAGNVTFVSGTKSGNDDNGHGTHVAGIAAAIAGNGKGVRGVAPNARLYAVKVLNSQGSGFVSWIIAGINWVTANALTGGRNIRVANMSLGMQGSSSSLDTAINNSVAAGITYAVAAGNSSMDASGFSPASNPNVITVSAMADSDGKGGQVGSSTSYGADDTFATFSNYGYPTVKIAAPGVDIYSCYNRSPYYATMSGTSMASPHVAGAVALYLSRFGGGPYPSPVQVRDALITNGKLQTDTANGFTGDRDPRPDGTEPLAWVAGW